MVHWDCLMAALDERAANGTVRQDTSRENIFLCQGYAQLKRLEYAFYLGFSLEEEGYAPEIGACYRQEDRFTGEERLIYALALLRGHSYQEFYTNGGTNDFRHMRPKEHYLEHLRRNLALTDNDALRRFMIEQAGLGLNDGCSFGRSLNGFMRLNAACPRATLEQALRQLEAAVNSP